MLQTLVAASGCDIQAIATIRPTLHNVFFFKTKVFLFFQFAKFNTRYVLASQILNLQTALTFNEDDEMLGIRRFDSEAQTGRWSVPKCEFEDLFSGPHQIESFERHQGILTRGQNLTSVSVLLTGWLIRYRITSDGNRQILHIILPGDIVAPDALLGGVIDHDVEALTDVTIRSISVSQFKSNMTKAPHLIDGVFRSILQEQSNMREHIVRIGRRNARDRVLHFLQELHNRLQSIGHADSNTMILPLTQVEIADTLGMSHVHTNRTMQSLTNEGLVEYSDGQLQFRNAPQFDLKPDGYTRYVEPAFQAGHA